MTIRLIIAAAVLTIFSACASQVTEAGYYWGNYANTLYRYAKEPSEETLTTHIGELNNIVAESEERGLKVPPGIYAELGYMDAKKGDDAAALAHYEAEMNLYPESRIFLERLTADKN